MGTTTATGARSASESCGKTGVPASGARPRTATAVALLPGSAAAPRRTFHAAEIACGAAAESTKPNSSSACPLGEYSNSQMNSCASASIGA